MTKAKLHEEVLKLCDQHKAPKALREALSALTEPKSGGASDVNDYTVFDADGKPLFVFCTYHRKWEPVTTEKDGEVVELFRKNPKSPNGLQRECDEGLASWRAQAKEYKENHKKVIDDLLAGDITNDEAKEAIEELEAARANHIAREDGLGTDEKPAA